MTRLTPEQLSSIPTTLAEFDVKLESLTGCNLRELALKTLEPTGLRIRPSNEIDYACVPLTAGDGVITGFSETVAAIINHAGYSARVTTPDRAGFSDALHRNESVFVADDSRFLAVDFERRIVVDNAVATGVGFACALECIASRAGESRDALVLGLGGVGIAATRWLLKRGWKVFTYDADGSRTVESARAVDSVDSGLRHTNSVLDATPSAGLLGAGDVNANTVYVCPGVPCGLTHAAVKKIGREGCLYDPLRIGVAVMAVAVSSGIELRR